MKLGHIRNSAFNFLGQLLPLFAGLVTVPVIIRGLGPERFSLLTLAWAALGYFTIFDLGFGRATTKALAESLHTSDENEIGAIYWSSMASLLVLSVVGMGILILAAPTLLELFKEIPATHKEESHACLYVLISALPIMTLTANARGAMEAQGRFFAINVLQLIVGVGSYVAPVLLLQTERPLLNVILALAIIRAISLVAHVYLNFKTLPALLRTIRVELHSVARLWRFAGWMTVSNFVAPILVYFDRFMLGMLLPIKEVAYYTTPIEVVTKLWIIPGSLNRVLFPEFAKELRVEPKRVGSLYRRSTLLLALAMFFPCAILGLGADLILRTWLNPEFAEHATVPLQILAVGIFFNSVAFIPFTFLQSLGRTRLIAFIHLAEVPFYGLVFWLLVARYGISGAALAWSARVFVDMIAMFFFANREI